MVRWGGEGMKSGAKGFNEVWWLGVWILALDTGGVTARKSVAKRFNEVWWFSVCILAPDRVGVTAGESVQRLMPMEELDLD